MFILTAYQTKNRCYQKGRAAKHVGILVHSTGAVNRNICRYVDAPDRLGVNRYKNHWNNANGDKCMHAFIGYDKNNEVIVVNTLPYEYACWGCGKGANGSYNYNPMAHIQFEVCQGSNTDTEYYRKAIGVAAEYCAFLCKKFGFSQNDICSHREAARAGYASNHGDPESWMKYFSDDMKQFRKRVGALIAGETPIEIGEATEMPGNGDTSNGGDTPTLRKGSKGASVATLQSLLLSLGYSMPVYGADGNYGAETIAAVTAFQADNGLATDGICGALTWAAITAALAANTDPDPLTALYTVTIPHLSAAEATYLLETYKGATSMTET